MDDISLRKRMVDEQLILRGIKDKRVLAAFYKVERHKFVPEKTRIMAYDDSALSIGEGQTISQPYMAALMTEILDLRGTERVLEIGTGSGYQAAILAELSKEVFTVERIESLAKNAQRLLLDDLGYTNIHIKNDDGTLGWSTEAPFERIIVTAASLRIPSPLAEQLCDNGKLVLPLGDTFSQILTLAEKKSGVITTQQICSCVFVPLIGKFS